MTCNGLSANPAYTADNCAASQRGGPMRYVHRMSHTPTAADECELFVLANLLGLLRRRALRRAASAARVDGEDRAEDLPVDGAHGQ